MSPSSAALRNRELSLAIEAARKCGDIIEMQRLLGQLTALMQLQFGIAISEKLGGMTP